MKTLGPGCPHESQRAGCREGQAEAKAESLYFYGICRCLSLFIVRLC